MSYAERNTDEVECVRCGDTVQLTEDGDVQDDGTVLWSGAQRGVCCALLYAGAVWDGHVGVYELEEAAQIDGSGAHERALHADRAQSAPDPSHPSQIDGTGGES